MKIRTDYVTNSSSISYIILMSEPEIKDYLDTCNFLKKEGEEFQVLNYIYKKIKEDGTIVCLDEHEMYYYTLDIQTDDTINREITTQEFEDMSESDKIAYIGGEYILKERLAKVIGGSFSGISVTRI